MAKKAKEQLTRQAVAARMKKARQDRTWKHIARLAESGLAALEAGNLKEVRACLNAVRGVAVTADGEGI